jgi:hypothetical protein
MESTDKRALSDKSVYPDDGILKAVLGRSYLAYCAMLELFDRHDMQHEWRYYMDGKSWLLKVQKKKQTIIWASAWEGFMRAAIYIPERLTESLYDLPIGEDTRERIRTTKNLGKSKPCIFEIRSQKVLKDMEKIMQFKIQSK